jgi:hypothetical protein
MPSFEELRSSLEAARSDREDLASEVSRLRQDLRRLESEKTRLARTTSGDSEDWQALLSREADQTRKLAEVQERLNRAAGIEGGLKGEFSHFTDPRREISRLPDDDPILLFPLRLETRFKAIKRDGAPDLLQLWVRVFPDDCSVDGFDDTLSESEVRKARNYWTNRWKIGLPADPSLEAFVEAKDRGTWAEFAGAFTPGRAHWIREHYRPVNEADMPARSSEQEVILVVPTDAAPAQAEQDALCDYWAALFAANGDAAVSANAFAALKATLALGDEAAKALIGKFAPDGFPAVKQAWDTPPPVRVVFLLFPVAADTVTKQTAWVRASRVTTLPERLVLMGFNADRAAAIEPAVGEPIPNPLIVGPDPDIDIQAELRAIHGPSFDDLSDDEKAELYVEYLAGRSETKWLFDFDEAVRVGMGFKVDISQSVFERGIHRLFLLGVKLSTADRGRTELEQLLAHHHFGESGLSFVAQGTPTNNTGTTKSGYTDFDERDGAYDTYHRNAAPADPPEPRLKRDGRWLVEILGIDPAASSLSLASGYFDCDQCEARAMNSALWSATGGYFMESMMTPVFSDWQRRFARWFLINHVSGRGRLPALRIGDQPYGILPATNWPAMRWFDEPVRDRTSFRTGLRFLHDLLGKMRADWSAMVGSVAFIGHRGADADAHALLLQALGLHPNSVEFDQRYAESFLQHYNWFAAHGRKDLVQKLGNNYRRRGLDLLARLGYSHDTSAEPKIPILETFFLTEEHDVTKPLIDDRELSESAVVRAYTDDGLNYIEWLIEHARGDHRVIRNQQGFTDNKAPFALLYDLLRHSLNLQFATTVVDFYREAALLDESDLSLLKKEADFVDVRERPVALESKWDLLYQSDARITQSSKLVVDHVSDLLRTRVVNSGTQDLHDSIDALELLKDVPTARLERLLVEHFDLCTYRLDAWMLGLTDAQLQHMRYERLEDGQDPRRGIYLGAFGWVEDLRRDVKTLTKPTLTDELQDIFDPDGSKQPMIDSANAGHVHAPSINHALTAAILRNAYISRASADSAEPYKVNLTSERVRLALDIVEGMQQGQSLGALLGYRLERDLHDGGAEELDNYIYELRKLFPLNSNKLQSTQIAEGRPAATPEEDERNQEEEDALNGDAAVVKIEARNVVDGLALLDHIRKVDKDEYPFGFELGDGPSQLKSAGPTQSAAINVAVGRLKNVRDAVADLAMAEGVHQVVQGNYERAAGALDAYSKGQYPQLPEVIRSPGSGASITHRFGIHFDADAAPQPQDSPRAKAEPAINAWIRDLMPTDLGTIACIVEHKAPTYDDAIPPAVIETKVTLEQLNLSPIDLLFVLKAGNEQGLSGLDDFVLRHLYSTNPPTDADVIIRYTKAFDPADGVLSLFELNPLVDSLRTLILSSRSLLPADMAVPNEGRREQNGSAAIDATRILAARQDVLDALDDLEDDVVDPLKPLIDPEDFEVALGNRAALIDQADTKIDQFVEHLNTLGRLGSDQAGFGFVYSRRRAVHAGVRTKVAAYRKRWRERRDLYDDLINNKLPAAVTDEEKVAILIEAEGLVSTTLTVPTPALAAYTAALAAKRNAFDLSLQELDTLLATNFATFKALFDAIGALKANLADFDATPLDIESEERQTLILLEDLLAQSAGLLTGAGKAMDEVKALADKAAASAIASERISLLGDAAKALFGNEFLILPRFTLDVDQSTELAKCAAAKDSLFDYQVNTLKAVFPLDDWLYGVARVRDKLAAWENLAILAEAFRERPPLDLTPLQLPYAEDEPWLALAWPDTFEITTDKLLYTAYRPDFAPATNQCGLLVDEWTEVIPAKRETTGLTFHFDRPNTEPPQAMLLVTPPAFTGQWQWNDIVAAMHETLDLAKLRAIEPDQVDATDYAQFLPSTVAATSAWPVTIAVNFAMASDKVFQFSGGDDA